MSEGTNMGSRKDVFDFVSGFLKENYDENVELKGVEIGLIAIEFALLVDDHSLIKSVMTADVAGTGWRAVISASIARFIRDVRFNKQEMLDSLGMLTEFHDTSDAKARPYVTVILICDDYEKVAPSDYVWADLVLDYVVEHEDDECPRVIKDNLGVFKDKS
jgi:hypothetical protein